MDSYYGVDQNSFIEVRSGSVWTPSFRWIQRSNNQPVDLTGCVAIFTMVQSRNNLVAFTDESDSSPTSISIDENIGRVALNVSAEMTKTFKPGLYKADLKIIFPDGSDKATKIFQVRVEEGLS